MANPLDHFAVISDIHSNYEALLAVFQHIQKRGCPRVFCLGDIIGYGPEPKKVVDLVRQYCAVVIKGNHDHALFHRPKHWNPFALKAIHWTQSVLTDRKDPANAARIEWLKNLPETYAKNGFLFIHGSPLDPLNGYLSRNDVYGADKAKMTDTIAAFDKICFVGHTHLPSIVTAMTQYMEPEMVGYEYKFTVKMMVNVGSVGQPRDGDPRASYVEFKHPNIYFHRVNYDIAVAQQKIRDTKVLDAFLADRLAVGQ